MQHTISAGNTNKKASSARRGARLVRVERRDLGLGAAGLVVVRALVLAGGGLGERAAVTSGRAGAVVEGGGGGSRSRRGDGDTMGSAERISH
jgi:hypothetical protein